MQLGWRCLVFFARVGAIAELVIRILLHGCLTETLNTQHAHTHTHTATHTFTMTASRDLFVVLTVRRGSPTSSITSINIITNDMQSQVDDDDDDDDEERPR